MKKEALSKFYLNYRLYIFPFIIILSCLILIVFIIFPQTGKLISNVGLEKELKNKHNILEAKAEILENLDQSDLSLKVDRVLSAYPSERDFASVVGLLQQLSNQSGFNIETLTLGQSTAGKYGDSQSYAVRLEILGPKNLFSNLITSIESSPRIMRVTTMDITSSRDLDVINVSLAVEVLYASLPSSFGTVDSPLPQLSQKDEELMVTLTRVPQPAPATATTTTPRGKANPFE